MTCVNETRSMSLIVMLAAGALWAHPGCSGATEPMGGMMSMADRTITHEDTARLAPGHHLVLDLRRDSFAVDPSLGAVDLRYVDIISPTGDVEALEQLISNVVATGSLTRADLDRGFSVDSSDGRIAVNANSGVARRPGWYLCLCSSQTGLCICEPTACP
jgi:hypothetical protein